MSQRFSNGRGEGIICRVTLATVYLLFIKLKGKIQNVKVVKHLKFKRQQF